MRRGNLQLVMLSVVLAAMLLAGCSQDKSNRIIDPSGEVPQPKIGVFKGRLDFGQPGPGLPRAIVMMARVTDPACESIYEKIEVIGTHSGWAEGTSPTLTYMGACVWMDTLTVPSGDWAWKFRTDDDWEASPDYATNGESDDDGLENTLGLNSGDLKTTLTAQQAGFLVCTLTEATDPARYKFEKIDVATATFSSTDDGSFEIRELELGTYNVVIRAPGFFPRVMEGVTLAGAPIDLGDVTMVSAAGAITGMITYENPPDPLPTSTINVRSAGEPDIVTSVEGQGSFTITGLETGTYDLEVRAPGYSPKFVTDVSFVNGENIDVGTVHLLPGCSSDFSTIQMIGEFNGWDISTAPHLTQIEGCIWSADIEFDGSSFFFKFITDGNWDNPEDFGSSTQDQVDIPGSFTAEKVSGGDTALEAIVAAPGTYTLTLDETQDPVVVTALPAGSGGTTGGIKGVLDYQGITGMPAIPARIAVIDGGMQVASTTADSLTGAFQIRNLTEDSYTVVISALCYENEQIPVVVPNYTVDLGTIPLQPGPSPHNSISLAGSFNGYDTGATMTEAPQCIWSYTPSSPLPVGIYDFLFVTNGVFFFPSDYGQTTGIILTVPAGETAASTVELVDGLATIRIQVEQEDRYRFVLDERTQRFSVSSASAGGTGSATGIVTFERFPSAPFPVVNVTAYDGAIAVVTTTSSSETGSFTIEGLVPGTYKIVASAGCFSDVELDGVQVGVDLVDIGAGSLKLDSGPSAFSSMSVAGDFNGFALDALMTVGADCVWLYETPDSIEVGTHLFKFVTNGQLDSPPDYGGDESTVVIAPGSGAVEVVSGSNTNIRIEVIEKRRYRFILVEWNRTFQVIAR
jgi:hypothetical protein